MVGGGGGGGALAVFCLFVCLLLHSIGFMLFIAKVRAEPWARTPEISLSISRGTILPVFTVDRLALSRLVTSSRTLGCCRSKP